MKIDLESLWNYAQPSQTRETFIGLADEIKETASLNDILELETQIGRTYSLEREFSKTHEMLDGVEDRLTDETKIARVRYLLERGRSFNSGGEKEKAKPLFVEASFLAQRESLDYLALDAIHMVAISASNFEEKLKWTEKGIAVANQTEGCDSKKWIGVFYNNAGWDLFEKERYEEALEKFIACRDFHADTENERGLSIAKWSVAKTYRFLERYDEALSIQLQSLEAKGGDDPSGYTFEEVGELYFQREDFDKAKIYFAKAHSILAEDKWFVKNEGPRLDRLQELSK